MEKKSVLIGGGIGLAVGLASMFGLVLGIGSCAGSQNVKKVDNSSVLVQRPKMAAVDGDSVLVYRIDTLVEEPVSYQDSWFSSSTTDLSLKCYRNSYNGHSYFIEEAPVTANGVQQDVYVISYTWSHGGGITVRGGNAPTRRNTLTLYYNADWVPTGDAEVYLNSLIATKTLGYISLDGSDLVFEEYVEPVESSNVVTDIFDSVVESISSFGQALGSSVSAITSVFYKDGAFTMLGYLTLITGGVALVYWCFYLLKNALHIGVK